MILDANRQQAIMSGDSKDTTRPPTNKKASLSLRNIIELPGEEKNETEGDFVFSDEIHRQQDFELFSNSLVQIGLLDCDAVDDEPKQLLIYEKGQKESFLRILDEIDKIQHAQHEKGLKKYNFTFGLMNCLLIAYIFGAHPQHFWILYLVETTFWMSLKFIKMVQARPLCEVFYYLDFCWIMNLLGVIVLPTFCFLQDSMSVEIRKEIYMAAYGIYCGPVFLAAMVLPFVAFLFHDVNTMANLIIHLMPSMMMYVFRWHATALYTAWPGIFHLKYVNDMKNMIPESDSHLPFWNVVNWIEPSVVRNALIVYFVWWIPYTIWMLLVGLKLPVLAKDEPPTSFKYDTVFHSLWRGGPCELMGKLVWKRPPQVSKDQSERNDFEIRDFMLYMILHALGCIGIGIGVIGGLCYVGGKVAHAILLLLATTACADRGAKRYTYYVTAMYGQKLRKAFHELQDHDKKE
jgi:hypothetical protein